MVIKLRRVDVGVDEANELLNQAGLASINTMDCLLYTSPSPRDVEESRMPSSA